MEVFIKPNPNTDSVHNYVAIREFKTGKKEVESIDNMRHAPLSRHTICFCPSSSRPGTLNTGDLLEMTKNPEKNNTNLTPEWQEHLFKKEEVPLQTLLEFRHGRKPGEYSPRMATDIDNRKENLNIPFLQRAESQLTLRESVNRLNTDIPLQELQYYIAKAHPQIANDYSEMTGNHLYYIDTKQSEEDRKQTTRKAKNQAKVKLESIEEENLVRLVKVMDQIFHIPDITPKKAYEELDAFIDKDSKSNETVVQFDRFYKIYKEDREEFHARALYHDLIAYGVINRQVNDFIWYPPKDKEHKEPVTWSRYEDIIKYLKNKKYQPERELMLKQLEAQKR